MPIDLLLHFDDGSSAAATIPLAVNKNAAYRKPDNGFNYIPYRLPAWDWVSPEYQADIGSWGKSISWFEIDTSWRLQDLNWLNYYSCWVPPGEWAVWKQLFVNPPIDKYWAVLRPIIWPDAFSGINAGVGVKYGMNNSFSGDFKVIYKTRPGGSTYGYEENGVVIFPKVPWYDYVDGALTLSSPVDWLGRLSNIDLDVEKMYGI